MKILIVGNYGSEHALAWKLKQSPKVTDIFIAPGNAGTALVGTNINIKESSEIIRWLKDNSVDLVLIRPDNYLAEGLADEIQKLKIPVFGPTQKASEIEWSKSFAKQFMLEEGIPTARFAVFTEKDKALGYVQNQSFPLVIKANGLALGKGVIVAQTLEEATGAIVQLMETSIFGDAGKEIVIEEYLVGREISIHAFCDGETSVLFPSSQDHKRIFDNDNGPNTGGMGTIAPVPWVTDSLMEQIKKTIVEPCLAGLKKRGRPFVGVLYPGVIVTAEGPKVVEFNARFGDPETQSYMRLLKTDLVDIILACVNQKLSSIKIEWSDTFACCVILASGGYPGQYNNGKIISGLDDINDADVVCFHSSTDMSLGQFVTKGGRVLGITAVGVDLSGALEKSYKAIEKISFEGMQFRKDIGRKSI